MLGLGRQAPAPPLWSGWLQASAEGGRGMKDEKGGEVRGSLGLSGLLQRVLTMCCQQPERCVPRSALLRIKERLFTVLHDT